MMVLKILRIKVIPVSDYWSAFLGNHVTKQVKGITSIIFLLYFFKQLDYKQKSY